MRINFDAHMLSSDSYGNRVFSVWRYLRVRLTQTYPSPSTVVFALLLRFSAEDG